MAIGAGSIGHERVTDIPAGMTSERNAVLHNDGATPRILVVEDEPLVLMVAVDLLEEMGCAVEEAANGLEALARMTEQRGAIDAAVIDIGLPDRKGDELAAELRQMRGDLPIVIASGHSEADLKARFRGDTQVAVLTKPYSGQQLAAALQSLGIALTASV